MSEIVPAPTIPSYAMTAINQCEFIGKSGIVTKNLNSAVSDGTHVFYTFTNDLSASGTCTITEFQTRTMTPPQWAKYFENDSDYTNYATICNTLDTISEMCSALEQAGGSPIPSIVADLASIFLSSAEPDGYNTIGKALSYAYAHNFASSKLMTIVQSAKGGLASGSGTTWMFNYVYS
jgi:hypothetical protein